MSNSRSDIARLYSDISRYHGRGRCEPVVFHPNFTRSGIGKNPWRKSSLQYSGFCSDLRHPHGFAAMRRNWRLTPQGKVKVDQFNPHQSFRNSKDWSWIIYNDWQAFGSKKCYFRTHPCQSYCPNLIGCDTTRLMNIQRIQMKHPNPLRLYLNLIIRIMHNII